MDGRSPERGSHPFRDREEFAAWEERHREHRVQRVDIGLLDRAPCFLGIDSGFPTLKILLMDGDGRVALTWYAPSGGDPDRRRPEGD